MLYLKKIKYIYKENIMLLIPTLKNYLATKGVKPYEQFKVYHENNMHICEITETAFWEYRDKEKFVNEDLAYFILNNTVYIEKD